MRIVVYRFFKVLCRMIFGLIGKPVVSGVSNIPRRGSFVLLANHQSVLDPLLLMAYVPHRVTFLAASYIFKIPLIGRIVQASGALPVNVREGNLGSVRRCLPLLLKGGVVGLFPEGGISKDGQLRPFRTGWAYIALKTGASALPVGISGSREVLPVGKYIPRRGKIQVNIGEPVTVDRKSKIYRHDLHDLNWKMENEIKHLMTGPQETSI